MDMPSKQRVRDALVHALSETVSQAAEQARTTREGATHAEAKPENDKDTRALEQSYLARGQAMRVEELANQAHMLRFMDLPQFSDDDEISAGALVLLEGADGERLLFLAPHGGGIELSVDNVAVLVVTATSPMGRAVLGKSVGDEAVLKVRGTQRNYEISRVR
jgi:transcription elongation GreA/GreB family factor